jgi:hypothetical protein
MSINYSRKYTIARNITYICLFISSSSFVFKAYFIGTPITLIWWIWGATIVGVPACLAYYYYDGMRELDSDESVVDTETLEKAEEEDPNLGKELNKQKPPSKQRR